MSYILLIEDNQNNADMMIRILQTAGFEVKHFLKGLDGAKQARKETPALILMDFNLLDIDGRILALTLRKQLREDTMLPIIACTARAGKSEERLAEHFGCTAFLSKPFTSDELLEMVNRFIVKKPAYQQDKQNLGQDVVPD